MMPQGPFEIRSRESNGGQEIVAHGLVWTVMTDDENHFGAFALRVAGHGQDPYDSDALVIVIDPEMAFEMVNQFIQETIPYAERLPK